MAKQAVGGQAVIEGVMMQSKDKRAVAVRKSDGEIALKEDRIKSWVRDKNIDKIPFVRGSFVMIDTMIQGIKSLNFSSEFFMEEAEEVSCTHLRAQETDYYLVCCFLLEYNITTNYIIIYYHIQPYIY
ncbi:hypothetical protein BGV14_14490 [Clostridioides difficile]|uniref:DUF1385 domain-containing protein n=1 Tax=Clostridioides difficile TaxID=1496 RepID=UPI000BCE49E0|nr:DUF1385 domain-containing protein [Clostridioides difficile]PBH80675.1 hypothetical protein BGV14_14490 [Clostridioides difficile]